MTPPAVWGRCRWVTTPATLTRAPSPTDRRSTAVTTPSAARRRRRNRVGCPSGDTPVAHRSARATSEAPMAGSDGGSVPVTTPARRAGPVAASAPAAHRASLRSTSKAANAPAVANASMAGRPGSTRRWRSSIDVYGRPAAMASARSPPMLRTDSIPIRMAGPPRLAGHGTPGPPDPRSPGAPETADPRSPGSRVASAADLFRSGVRTSTPWRRTSWTRVCGE